MFGSMHTYTSVLDRSMEAERISVSVLGTGPLGLALATRLAEAGAEVRLGSRSGSLVIFILTIWIQSSLNNLNLQIFVLNNENLYFRDVNSVRCQIPPGVKLVQNKVN